MHIFYTLNVEFLKSNCYINIFIKIYKRSNTFLNLFVLICESFSDKMLNVELNSSFIIISQIYITLYNKFDSQLINLYKCLNYNKKYMFQCNLNSCCPQLNVMMF